MNRTFLVDVSSDQEDFNADHDFAVVTVDTVLAQKLLTLWWESSQRASNAVPEVYPGSFELTWFDDSPDFISYATAEKLGLDLPEDRATLKIAKPRTEEHRERTECTRVHVSEDGIRWNTIPRHCNFRVTTAELTWADLGLR